MGKKTVKYNHASIIPLGISMNKVYDIFENENEKYIINDNNVKMIFGDTIFDEMFIVTSGNKIIRDNDKQKKSKEIETEKSINNK